MLPVAICNSHHQHEHCMKEPSFQKNHIVDQADQDAHRSISNVIYTPLYALKQARFAG